MKFANSLKKRLSSKIEKIVSEKKSAAKNGALTFFDNNLESFSKLKYFKTNPSTGEIDTKVSVDPINVKIVEKGDSFSLKFASKQDRKKFDVADKGAVGFGGISTEGKFLVSRLKKAAIKAAKGK